MTDTPDILAGLWPGVCMCHDRPDPESWNRTAEQERFDRESALRRWRPCTCHPPTAPRQE
jgi:hypothetical protein